MVTARAFQHGRREELASRCTILRAHHLRALNVDPIPLTEPQSTDVTAGSLDQANECGFHATPISLDISTAIAPAAVTLVVGNSFA